ncbi:MAG: XdhC family protein [Anaerolineae bacterium]|nr:XdhC family protein [Gloeobacterales cyanobacterium ES-bin-313]
MHELRTIAAAWAVLAARGEEAVLATVVKVEGSSYRCPGARMLIAQDGRYWGTISGGCLEGNLVKKVWWYLRGGVPIVKIYDTAAEENGELGFGLGCQGVIHVLLEHLGRDSSFAKFLTCCLASRRRGVVATLIGVAGCAPASVGQRLLVNQDGEVSGGLLNTHLLEALRVDADEIRAQGGSQLVTYGWCEGAIEAFVEAIEPPPVLVIFGVGHDTVPLVRLAKELGYDVTVAGYHSLTVTAARFPTADRVIALPSGSLLPAALPNEQALVVLMTHNYASDLKLLKALLPRKLAYLGVLGPRARTERMLKELSVGSNSLHFDGPERLYAPIGLDIGAGTPQTIALAILAEIQAVQAGRCGGMLRDRREPIHLRLDPIERKLQPESTC